MTARSREENMVPAWLHVLSVLAILAGFACAAVIVIDEIGHPQKMWIMYVVWPAVALFGTVLTVWAYYAYGRGPAAGGRAKEEAADGGTPFAVKVGKGAAHCGSGCTLGDIVAEWLAFAFPAIAVWLGWKSLFAEKTFAVWILDYVLAFLFGIAFQYFTIAPMRGLSPGEGILAAVKADAASLTAWQVGMYGFMAFAAFYLFRQVLGVRLEVDSFEFWFMMQIAMLCGFMTSYPVNWWLIRSGLKEAM
jgi:hypothetical protein